MAISDDTFGGEDRHRAYVWLGLWGSIVGTLCSLLTIVLIIRMKSNTGHLHLVFLMSVYQLIYDVSFSFSDINFGYYPNAASNFTQLLGGISSALISNWIAYVAMYIVLFRKKIDVFENIVPIHVTTILPAFVVSLIYLFAAVPKSNLNASLKSASIVYVYNNIRLLSIFLNFVFVVAIAIRIYNSGGNKTPQEIAMRTLCLRMIYYPFVQAIGRSGYTWYEFAYGPKPEDADFNSFPDLQYGVLLLATIVAPAVSVGYLIIFLMMQPNAYREMILMFTCRSSNSKSDSSEDANAQPKVQSNQETDAEDGSSPSMADVYNDSSSPKDRASEYPDDYRSSAMSQEDFSPMEDQANYVDWTRKSYMFPGTEDNRDDDELYSILQSEDGGRSSMMARHSSNSIFGNTFMYYNNSRSRTTVSNTINNPINRSDVGTNGLFVTENVLHTAAKTRASIPENL